MGRISGLAISFALMLFTQVVQVRAEEMPVEAFLAAYRPALERLEKEYSHIVATATMNRADQDVEIEYFARDLMFQSVRNYPELREGFLKGRPRQEVKTEGPEGDFTIHKTNVNSDYFIVAYSQGVSEDIRTYHQRYDKPFTFAATHPFKFRMRDLLDDPRVRFVKVMKTDKMTDDAFHVAASIDLSNFDDYFKSAELVFAPNHGWRLITYELIPNSPGSEEPTNIVFGEIEYGPPFSDGKIPVDSVKLELGPREGARQLMFRWDAKGWEFSDSPPKRFTLEFFGLGQKPLVRENSGMFSWMIWGNLAVLVVCGIVLLRRARLRSTRGTS